MDAKSGRDDHIGDSAECRMRSAECGNLPKRQAGRPGNRKPGTASSRQAAKTQSREAEKQAHFLRLCAFAPLRESNLKPALRPGGQVLDCRFRLGDGAGGMVRYIREEVIAYEQARRVSLTP